MRKYEPAFTNLCNKFIVTSYLLVFSNIRSTVYYIVKIYIYMCVYMWGWSTINIYNTEDICLVEIVFFRQVWIQTKCNFIILLEAKEK